MATVPFIVCSCALYINIPFSCHLTILPYYLSAGNGECTNSRCECMDGYTGGACDCPTNTSSCRPEGSSEGMTLCSGVGECICGQCVCNNYSVNFGRFCEQCQVSVM